MTTTDWGAIDQTSAAPTHCIGYLNTVSELDQVAQYKAMTFELLHIQLGQRVLDVGCGAGNDVRSIAQQVGAEGLVIGLDNSATMLASARNYPANQGLNLRFEHGSINALPFPDGYFDSCRADRVFQHLEDRKQALAEILRVTKVGGRIVVSDTDWESLLIDGPDKALLRYIVRQITDRVRNGWSGRQLPRLFQLSGLQQVRTTPMTIIETNPTLADQLFGIQSALNDLLQQAQITREAALDWERYCQTASRLGVFFSAITGFGVVGIKG
ncbi:class I SAM-dependent methyltransferase [Herpetosiphon gulosus]|uniref:2-methoxy-6-polyprenyl-1,4-benzoquinol methylase, mitochondrial n=1 Tax=Herpetosiphon gulosus TaxID=1973496 RepID=A0ABP9X6V8_9CHLR